MYKYETCYYVLLNDIYNMVMKLIINVINNIPTICYQRKKLRQYAVEFICKIIAKTNNQSNNTVNNQ